MIFSGFFCISEPQSISFKPPGQPVYHRIFFWVSLLPVSRILEAFITIIKSPVSTLGVQIGLCLPLNIEATSEDSLPRVWSVASITYHLWSTSAGFAIYDFTIFPPVLRYPVVYDDISIPMFVNGAEAKQQFRDYPMYSALIPVSYTHLTLPTICSVQISVVAVSLKKKKNGSAMS
eukprot:TRINITY_DN5799_c0_g1_i2.p2 TRINITY_DN5799_c0_g1~~TRINITY_DN5799_c0_g1_i2.p2  ORF type:complete len:176 (+),score=4.21 TRINITY_DN5799_c0_g1_i2:295-822(+)